MDSTERGATGGRGGLDSPGPGFRRCEPGDDATATTNARGRAAVIGSSLPLALSIERRADTKQVAVRVDVGELADRVLGVLGRMQAAGKARHPRRLMRRQPRGGASGTISAPPAWPLSRTRGRILDRIDAVLFIAPYVALYSVLIL